ncbi:MAG TPA: hypothetical protein VFP79_11895 [Pseudolabrys sp.]|nr:hypothetical protein [Pseudolabrys sp.]
MVNGLLSSSFVLPASVAGALAAFFLVMVVVAVRQGGLSRLLLLLALVVLGALAVVGLLDRFSTSERLGEQRALLQRDSQLSISAVASGSPLACLEGLAGEQVENACEQAVFADAQSTAKAVAFVTARLSLLADVFASARGDEEFLAAFATGRRAIELDRYGLAAHVLAVRDGCTTERCAAFVMFRDTAALKANLKVSAFDNYVARYASTWSKAEPPADKQPQASTAPQASVTGPGEQPAPHPVDSRYDFPSAASIPPVSIMNAEPPPPKEHTGTASTHAGEKPAAHPPVPPKRPQAQAPPPPAR